MQRWFNERSVVDLVILRAKVRSRKRKCQSEMCNSENANELINDLTLELRYEKGRIEVGRRPSKRSPHGLLITSAK